MREKQKGQHAWIMKRNEVWLFYSCIQSLELKAGWRDPQSKKSCEPITAATLEHGTVEQTYSSEKLLSKHRVWGTEFIYFTINYPQQSARIPELFTRRGSL